MTGWHLSFAKGISADGRTIVGCSDNEAWIAHTPEPGTFLLLVFGLIAARRWR
ncbi:MAG: PEP-CTERM sorting domain-containing protein [Planctomycetes bacterium]|nr:PEP-CTERM sorting domain-containing protein [Planctomycetota bacterium]